MAISTYKTFLMKGTKSGDSVTYAKLVDIKSFSDLGGSPEMLEITTLSDGMQKYIPGIKASEALEFEANYDKADYISLEALKGVDTPYAIWFGGTESGVGVTPTGEDGKFEFSGQLSVRVVGGSTNEPVGMSITIAPSSEIKLAE